MLEKAETYEEAVAIIKSSITSEVAAHNKRVLGIRVVLTALAGLAACVCVTAIAGDSSAGLTVLPIFGLITLSSLFVYLGYLRNRKRVSDGSFFDRLSEEETIQMANEFVETYNDYISQLKSRKKSL